MTPPRDGALAAANARNAVRGIRVRHEPQEEVRLAMQELVGTASLGQGRPQTGFQLRAQSQSGKSTILEAVARSFNEDPALPAGHMPVPYVRVEVEGTFGSIPSDILRALGERFPYMGKPPARWARVRDSIRDRHVVVLAFDEFHRAGRGIAMSAQIGGRLQSLMDEGLCAAAFVGEPSQADLFTRVPSLLNRLEAPVHLPPLRWHDDADRANFVRFAGDYDDALVAAGVTGARSGLGSDAIAEPLLEASAGLIGYFCRIIENAAMRIAREGRTVLNRDDLLLAVDDWAIGNGRIETNPFA